MSRLETPEQEASLRAAQKKADEDALVKGLLAMYRHFADNGYTSTAIGIHHPMR